MKTSIVLVLAALLPLAGAAHHSEWCTPSTEVPEVDVTLPTGRYYVDNQPQHDWFITAWIWIYEEANGQPGLQRNDEFQDDTCGHPELADRLIW